jgi:hypothetical protein
VALDEARGRIVLFGGGANDTWTWDGSAWALETTPARPPADSGPMCYDAQRRRIVLLAPATPGVTWEWDGAHWLARQTGPSVGPGWYAGMAFDRRRGVCVSFGDRPFPAGSDATFEYAPVAPALATPYGSGCAGAAGTPVLAPLAGELPWLADSFGFALGRLPVTANAALLAGVSRTVFGPFALPLDLGFLAMPGCALRASPEAVVHLRNVNGSTRVSVPIPDDASLIGRSLHLQGLATDPHANPAGIVWSNGLSLTFGAR